MRPSPGRLLIDKAAASRDEPPSYRAKSGVSLMYPLTRRLKAAAMVESGGRFAAAIRQLLKYQLRLSRSAILGFENETQSRNCRIEGGSF